MIFEDAKRYGLLVSEGRVIYMGVIFEMNDGVLEIFTSERDFYQPMPDRYMEVFLNEGFLAGMRRYTRDKYERQLDRINRMMSEETSGRNNQKRIEYLTTSRERVLSKIGRPLQKLQL